jgi:nucleotide-binding universal stress UspA family protein
MVCMTRLASREAKKETRMFHTVIVGADDSSTALQAVMVAAEIAEIHGGTLHIVTAYDPKSVQVQELPEELRYTTVGNPADRLLESLSRIVKQRGLAPVVHAATGSPDDAIVRIAEQEHADLVVVGNKGMRGVRRVLGSIPNSVAHSAPCSVLIVDTEPSN